jgi:hypothetical protein
MSSCRQDLDLLDAGGLQTGRDPFPGAFHINGVLRQAGNARNAKKVKQIFQVLGFLFP